MDQISCIAAADRALKRTGELLFKPFDLVYWLILSLCAWLSLLGEGGVSFPNFNFNFSARNPQQLHDAFSRPMQNLRDACHGDWSGLRESLGVSDSHLALFLVIAVLVLLFILVFSLALIWFKSQGDFLFIDHIVRRRPGFFKSFQEHCRLGTSSFLWRVVFYLVSGLLTLVATLLPLFLWYDWLRGCVNAATLSFPDSAALTGLILSFSNSLIMLLLTALIDFYYRELIVPIMYVNRCGAWEATRTFGRIFLADTWIFIKYLLVMIVVQIAVAMITFLLILVTCCILLPFLMLPWIWALLLLPLLLFKRLCGLELLNQYYKDNRF